MGAGRATLGDLADSGGGYVNVAFTWNRRWLGEISVDGRLSGFTDDGGFHE
jgi:hypothetical protein